MTMFARAPLALVPALILASATGAMARDTTRVSVDWPGYYHGPLRCAGCDRAEAWIRLSGTHGATRVEIVENRRSARPIVVRLAGEGHWLADGSTIELTTTDATRRLFVSEGYVELAEEPGAPAPRSARPVLRKASVYAGGGQQLFVTGGGGAAGKAVFEGVINFERPPEGGHRSLQARFEIDCRARTYTTPRIGYFSDEFATGKLIHGRPRNDDPPRPLAGGDDVVAQAATDFCAR